LPPDPQRFLEGLNVIKQSTLAYVAAAKASGISGIYYAVQHARFSLLSPAEYSLFGAPLDEEILAAASDLWLNIVHLHGDADIMFDLVADYPVQVMNWHDRDSGFSLAEGHKQFPGAVSGGVSRWTIQREAPGAVIAEAVDAVQQLNGRGLVVGTGCVIMTNTPLQNIRALREFVDRPA
jgi:uroporphyrinogen decarboxylase